MEEYPEMPEGSTTNEVLKQLRAQQMYSETMGNDQTSFAELMLEDNSIPEKHRDKFSVFFDKENALTRIPEKNEAFDKILLMYENSVNWSRLLMPEYEEDAEFVSDYQQGRYKHLIKVLRSTGGADRERRQYNLMVTRDEKEQRPMVSGGVLSKIRGLFK